MKKDWEVTVEEGTSGDLIRLFFNEIGLDKYSEDTVSDAIEYSHPLSYNQGKVWFCKSNVDNKKFSLPSDWVKAKKYILDTPEIKVGDWVDWNGHTLIWNGGKNTDGLWVGEWRNDLSMRNLFDKSKTKLTNKQLLERLMPEIKKRGFLDLKKGDIAKGIKWSNKYSGEKITFSVENGNIWMNGLDYNVDILRNGKWGTITKAKSEPPKLNGYEGEYDKKNERFTYGCLSVYLHELKMLENSFSESIMGIDLNGGYRVTRADIKELIKYAEKA